MRDRRLQELLGLPAGPVLISFSSFKLGSFKEHHSEQQAGDSKTLMAQARRDISVRKHLSESELKSSEHRGSYHHACAAEEC